MTLNIIYIPLYNIVWDLEKRMVEEREFHAWELP